MIKIFNSDGTVSDYRLLSERLPEFLKKFPPSEYSVEVTAKDLLETRPQYSNLLSQAIVTGKTLDEAGLSSPKLTFVFTATLRDRQGRLIANEMSMQSIQNYKDYERGVTAARQRLLAALGFGGNVFDNDEKKTIKEMDGSVENVTPEPAQAPEPKKRTRRGKKKTQSSESTNPQQTSDPDPVVATAVPEALIRQIQHQAQLKGVDAPHVSTMAEAKTALQTLLS